MNLLPNVKITKVHAYEGTAAATHYSDEVDMLGWDGVLFLASIGTAAADNAIWAQGALVTGFGTPVDLLGTLTPYSKTDMVLDIYRPIHRFMRCAVARATTTTIEAIWAIQYKGILGPLTNITVAQAAETHASPAAGTP